MTTDTKAVARWDIGNDGLSDEVKALWHYKGRYVLFTDHERVVGELTSNVHELERLCDATYVAQGADAYNHACDLIEQLQAERIGKGRDPGTEGSLCDGLTWAYGELLESEDECETLRSALAASRAEVEENENIINVWRGRTQRAEAEVDGLNKDAERYRWLRVNCIWETTISDEIEKVIDEELESTNV